MTPESLPAAAPASGAAANPAPAPAPEPTHPCIRCGRPVADPSAGLCELCNPLELAQPSATQVHGIAALGIIVFVVVLAVAAHSALAGTGPFSGSITAVAPAPGGLAITLSVRNDGTKAGATTCQILPATGGAGLQGDLVQTPPIPAASSLTFSTTITQLGTSSRELIADCQSP
jgi:hypothetical protein